MQASTAPAPPDRQHLQKYGLASALRSPVPPSSATFGPSTSAIPKRATPGQALPAFATPSWTAFDSGGQGRRQAAPPSKMRMPGSSGSGSASGSANPSASARLGQGQPEKSLLALRKASRPLERSSSAGGAPSRPPRPVSPSLHPLPLIPKEHAASAAKNRLYASSPAKVKPLDLGIRMDSVYSSYTGTKSTPNLALAPESPPLDDLDSGSAQLGVAARVSRGESIAALGSVRKASIGTIIPAPSSSASSSSSTPPSIPPSALPTRRYSADRPLGAGPKTSYAGPNQIPTILRRNSSLYLANPSPASQAPTLSLMTRGTTPVVLVTLAKRTSHISNIPGYTWRLHLLEKLEIVMGAFLTISEAEDILSIGNGIGEKVSCPLALQGVGLDLTHSDIRHRCRSRFRRRKRTGSR